MKLAVAAALALAAAHADAASTNNANLTMLTADIWSGSTCTNAPADFSFPIGLGDGSCVPQFGVAGFSANCTSGVLNLYTNATCSGVRQAWPMGCNAPAGATGSTPFGFGCKTYPANELLEWKMSTGGCDDNSAAVNAVFYLVLNQCQTPPSFDGGAATMSFKFYLTGTYPNLNVTANIWEGASKCSGSTPMTMSIPLSVLDTQASGCAAVPDSSSAGAGRRLGDGGSYSVRIMGDAALAPTTGGTPSPSSAARTVGGALAAVVAAVVVGVL